MFSRLNLFLVSVNFFTFFYMFSLWFHEIHWFYFFFLSFLSSWRRLHYRCFSCWGLVLALAPILIFILLVFSLFLLSNTLLAILFLVSTNIFHTYFIYDSLGLIAFLCVVFLSYYFFVHFYTYGGVSKWFPFSGPFYVF